MENNKLLELLKQELPNIDHDKLINLRSKLASFFEKLYDELDECEQNCEECEFKNECGDDEDMTNIFIDDNVDWNSFIKEQLSVSIDSDIEEYKLYTFITISKSLIHNITNNDNFAFTLPGFGVPTHVILIKKENKIAILDYLINFAAKKEHYEFAAAIKSFKDELSTTE